MFGLEDLRRIADAADGRVYVLRMRDRLADHGLVGVAVVACGAILNFVMSCRVIGLRGESALLAGVMADPGAGIRSLSGRIVQTDRNLPVRDLYRNHGFADRGQGGWEMMLPAATPVVPEPALEDAGR